MLCEVTFASATVRYTLPRIKLAGLVSLLMQITNPFIDHLVNLEILAAYASALDQCISAVPITTTLMYTLAGVCRAWTHFEWR